MSATLPARQPSGLPVGGQFTANSRAAASIDLLAPAPEPELPPGITEAAVDEFTTGKCQVLAEALSERTGWPVVVVADVEGRLGWFHAAVRTAEGTIVDIKGEHTEDDWLDDYGAWADEYGYDLAAEDPDYEYDGDCIQICEPTPKIGWVEYGLDRSQDPELSERARSLAGRLLDARESGVLPQDERGVGV